MIPSDKINLRLILVSGKTKEFLFSPSESAGEIAKIVFEQWPEDWESEAVDKAEILRLIPRPFLTLQCYFRRSGTSIRENYGHALGSS